MQIEEIYSSAWGFVSENSFVGALTSGLALLAIVGTINLVIKKYRANRVYAILQKGLAEKNVTYLPTAYLASESGYTQSQIEALCSHHKKIKRNGKKLESWRLK